MVRATIHYISEHVYQDIIKQTGISDGIQDKTAFITQEIVDAFIRCLMEKKGVPHSRGFEIRDSVLNSAHL